jgi:hypothetical protein
MFALLLGLGLVDAADRPTSRGRGRPDGGAWRVPNRIGSRVAARASMGAMGFRGRFSLPFRQVLRGHRAMGAEVLKTASAIRPPSPMADIWLNGSNVFHMVKRVGGILTTLRATQPAHTPLLIILEAPLPSQIDRIAPSPARAWSSQRIP